MAGEKPGGRHACGLTLGLKFAGCFGGSAPLSYHRSKSIVSESRRDATLNPSISLRTADVNYRMSQKKYVPRWNPRAVFL